MREFKLRNVRVTIDGRQTIEDPELTDGHPFDRWASERASEADLAKRALGNRFQLPRSALYDTTALRIFSTVKAPE